MTPFFIHPQAILSVYMIISDEHNQSYIKKCPCSFKLYNGSEWVQKVHPSIIKSAPHGPRGLIKAFWSEFSVFLYQKYPYLKLYKP